VLSRGFQYSFFVLLVKVLWIFDLSIVVEVFPNAVIVVSVNMVVGFMNWSSFIGGMITIFAFES
jgi:hypothetical protein